MISLVAQQILKLEDLCRSISQHSSA